MKRSRIRAVADVTAVAALCLFILSFASCNSRDDANAQGDLKNKGQAVGNGNKQTDAPKDAKGPKSGHARDGKKQADKPADTKEPKGEDVGDGNNRADDPSGPIAEPNDDDPDRQPKVAKGPIILQITSKLGVKTKVKVETTRSGIDPNLWSFAKDSDRHPLNHQFLVLDRGNALCFIVPLRHVKTITAEEEVSLVTLTDGSKHRGRLCTTISVDPAIDDSNEYDLAKAAEVVNETSSQMKKPDQNRTRFTLKVAETDSEKKEISYPASRTFDVYAPKTGQTGDPFIIILGTEEFKAKPSDFERIVLRKDEKGWQMNVKAPESPEKTGRSSGCDAVFETTSGSYVVYSQFVGNPAGFILEKRSGIETEKK